MVFVDNIPLGVSKSLKVKIDRQEFDIIQSAYRENQEDFTFYLKGEKIRVINQEYITEEVADELLGDADEVKTITFKAFGYYFNIFHV